MISQLQRSPLAFFGRAWATCRPENTLHMQWITPDLAVLLVSDPTRGVQPSGERLKVMTRGAAWVWFKEGMVKHRMAVLLLLCLVALPCCSWAQDESGGEDDPAITSSLGMPLSFPLNPTHQYAGLGLGEAQRHAQARRDGWVILSAAFVLGIPLSFPLNPTHQYAG